MLVRKLKHAWQYLKTDGLVYTLRVAASKFLKLLHGLLPPLTYKSLYMFLRLGYWPNIRNPRSFNEKISHRQLFAQHPLSSLISDKWRVREYVAQRGLAHILNKVYWVGENPKEIPFDDLPDKFVIKANHGSGWNIFVKNKSKLNKQQVIQQCRRWLNVKYSRESRIPETVYDNIRPLIIVERYFEDQKYEVPLDYKIHCFHGKVHYIDVICNSKTGIRTKSSYDPQWNRMNYRYRLPKGDDIPRPAKLNEMLNIAERLSSGIDYCRVDLYLLNNEKLLFGEITLNPIGGVGKFYPREWDFKFGELW